MLQPPFYLPSKLLSDICNPCVPSTPSYTTVFSSQKPFYTQPNYSSWWLGIFLAALSRGSFSGLTFLKAICLGVFTGRCWNAGVFPIWQLLIARDNFRLLTSVLLLAYFKWGNCFHEICGYHSLSDLKYRSWKHIDAYFEPFSLSSPDVNRNKGGAVTAPVGRRWDGPCGKRTLGKYEQQN